jgi:hypothetical protein
MIKSNHNKESSNKEEEIEILKKTIEDLETNLKKEKVFFENEIKKKDSEYKRKKESYESEISRVKKSTMEEFTRMLTEITNDKNIIDEERMRLKKI